MSNFLILKPTLHATHLRKVLEKMCKHEMDPTSIIEDTEQTWLCPQTDRQTDGQMDKVKPVYPAFNFLEVGGIIMAGCQIGGCMLPKPMMTKYL